MRTVVALRNAVLDPAALSEVGDLCPVLVWVCAAAEFCGVGSTLRRGPGVVVLGRDGRHVGDGLCW